MMDCAQLREHYEDYALGVLEGPELAELEAHLARGCDVCTPGVERARWLVSQLAFAAPEQTPPAAARAKLMQAVRPLAEPAPRRNWFPVWVWLPAAATILFALYAMNENRKLQQDIAQLDAFTARGAGSSGKHCNRARTVRPRNDHHGRARHAQGGDEGFRVRHARAFSIRAHADGRGY